MTRKIDLRSAARRAGRYSWAWLAAEWAEMRAAPPDRDRPRGERLIRIERERVPHPDRPGRHRVRVGVHVDLAGIVRRLRHAWEWLVDEWTEMKVDRWKSETEEFYRQAGHPNPTRAMLDEMMVRDELESVRDWVSVELLRTGRRPAELVAEWMERNVAAFAEFHGYQLSRVLVDALTHMPKHELLHPTALAAERAREKAYLDELHQKHFGGGRIRTHPRTLYVLGIRKRPEPLPGDILDDQCPEIEAEFREPLPIPKPPRRKKGDPPKNRPAEVTPPAAKRKSPAKRPKDDPPPEVTPPARKRKSPAKRPPATSRGTPRGSSGKRAAPRLR